MTNEPTTDADPFARLVRTHRLIEERLVSLERASRDLTDAARRTAGLETIADILVFFSQEGAQHNDDEEGSLFPQLRGLPEFKQMLDAFDVQHRMNDDALAELVAAARAFAPGAEAKVRHLAFRFAEMYRGHIMGEERVLFPAATKALAPDVIAQMGAEMTARDVRR